MPHACSEAAIIPGCSNKGGLLGAPGPKLTSAVPNVYDVLSWHMTSPEPPKAGRGNYLQQEIIGPDKYIGSGDGLKCMQKAGGGGAQVIWAG